MFTYKMDIIYILECHCLTYVCITRRQRYRPRGGVQIVQETPNGVIPYDGTGRYNIKVNSVTNFLELISTFELNRLQLT